MTIKRRLRVLVYIAFAVAFAAAIGREVYGYEVSWLLYTFVVALGCAILAADRLERQP